VKPTIIETYSFRDIRIKGRETKKSTSSNVDRNSNADFLFLE
jgi:hypothetical protein